jgi:hypothetical protein
MMAARTAASWTGLTVTSYFASLLTFGRGHQPYEERLGASLIALAEA